jgi:glycosyltransferase involved in cell wall biosynthesis
MDKLVLDNALLPMVSICIPTYNRLDLLKAALDSCFSQTFSNFEIVITDNSDNEETRRYVESLNRPNIRYFKNKKNIGPVENFALSVSLGAGIFIKPLMDDDLLMPTALEEMVNMMQAHPTVGVVMAPLNIINLKGDEVSYRAYLIKKIKLLYRYRKGNQLIPKKIILTDFLTKQYPCCVPTGLMYRKDGFDSLGPIDTKMMFTVDVEICARFSTSYDFYYIDKPLSSWRHSPLSYTVINLHKNGQDTVAFYDLTNKLCRDPRVLAQFSPSELPAVIKGAYFFASKRAVLSLLAGLRAMNLKLIIQTLQLIKKNDPYPTNLLLLPFNIASEVIVAGLSWLK